jgi:hypothetical protein
MQVMTSIQQGFKPFLSKYFSQVARYAVALTFGLFVIIKLFAIEAIVQSNHHLLLANQSLSNKQTVMLNQLNRLETKLTACESALKAHQVLAEDVKACRNQLDTMKIDLQQLQTQSTPAALALAFKQANPSLFTATKSRSEMVHAENQKISSYDMKKMSSPTVSANPLPFQALNIDMWNGEPMLMVNHHGHTDLLAKQDTLAGWTLVDIQFDAGWIRFRNRRGQLVKLTL